MSPDESITLPLRLEVVSALTMSDEKIINVKSVKRENLIISSPLK
jgi:hypothetical protein